MKPINRLTMHQSWHPGEFLPHRMAFQDALFEIIDARPDLDGYFMRADNDEMYGKGEWSKRKDEDVYPS